MLDIFVKTLLIYIYIYINIIPPIPQKPRNKFNVEISKKSTSKKRASARFFDVDLFDISTVEFVATFRYPPPVYIIENTQTNNLFNLTIRT